MKIHVIIAGSSSLKYSLFTMEDEPSLLRVTARNRVDGSFLATNSATEEKKCIKNRGVNQRSYKTRF
jgi:acetate kinase